MHKIITVSREFGSGGRELGKRLADALGFAYYDREIITAIAERSGLAERYVESVAERGETAYYPITFGRTFALLPAPSKIQMSVMVEQQKILLELAAKGDCVIVGRGADVILAEYRPLNLFVYADMGSKLLRCRKRQGAGERLSDDKLKKQIRAIDRQRAQYRKVLTDARWGDKAGYHLCINTTGLAIKALLPTAVQFQQCYFEGVKDENSSV